MAATLRSGNARWVPVLGALAAFAMVVGASPTVGAQPAESEPAAAAQASAPSITISLAASPATGEDFTFVGCRDDGGCGPFTLDDDTDPTLASTLIADALTPGTYTVTQNAQANWPLTDLQCSDGATVDLAERRATITITGNEAVHCEFTNTSAAITVAVDVDPTSTQAFGFTGCQGSGCAQFTLDDQPTDPTHPNSITGAVAPGTYTITQDALPGWYLNAITCTNETIDLDNRRVTITLEPGEQVHCRFDTVGRRLTIEQVADPASPGDFEFTTCRDGVLCTELTLDDDDGADPTHADTFSTSDLADGSYTITQATTAEWRLRSLTCSGGATIDEAERRVTIDFPAGRGLIVVCRFSNVTTALTIVQDSEPDDPQDFAFTGCLGAACADFSLDDDEDPALPRRLTVTGLAPGTYTVTQADNPGWPLRRLSCNTSEVVDLAARRATITLHNERTICTFTNGRPGITLVQDTEPDGPQDFTYFTCHLATGCATVTLDDDDDPALPRLLQAPGAPGGSYRISQASVPGYTRPEVFCSGVPWQQVSYFADGVTFDNSGNHDPARCVFTNQPAGPPAADAIAVPTAYYGGCVLATTGRVRCWGGRGVFDDATALAQEVFDDASNPMTGTSDLSVGSSSRCALGPNGRVRCWGANGLGQLGDGTTARRERPAAVGDPSGTTLTGAIQVSVGGTHACAVLQNGQARCWGTNTKGQLGDGTTTQRLRPVAVSNPDGTGPLTGVESIAAGGDHTCAVLQNGEARCWGEGALGDGSHPGTGSSLRPVTVSNADNTGPLTDVTEVVASVDTRTDLGHSCARLTSGAVWCWGSNGNGSGALGDGTTTDRSRPVAVLDVAGPGVLTGAAGLAIGSVHTCARLVSGEMRCWGRAGRGQLGHGATPSHVTRPVVVQSTAGSGALDDVTSIDAGHEHTCATQVDGEAVCWGQNFYWNLATGSTLRWAHPVEVLTAP